MRRTLLLATAVCALSGCGTERGRVPMSNVGAAESTIELKAGSVAFWSDLDLEWEGDGSLEYLVTLSQNGKPVATARCAPLVEPRVKVGWTETNLGGAHTRRGRGKLSCEATVPSGGKTLVQADLQWNQQPKTATVRKVDLVLKQ